MIKNKEEAINQNFSITFHWCLIIIVVIMKVMIAYVPTLRFHQP